MGNNKKGSLALRKKEIETRLFINGEFVKSTGGKTFETINPADESVITTVEEATEKDIDNAVAAAVAAFKPKSKWRTMSAYERGQAIQRIADGIEEKKVLFAELETLDNGKPMAKEGQGYGSTVDVDLAVKCFRYYAGWCDKIEGETIPIEGNMFCCTIKEPVGVCAQIIPWNFPLLMAAWKIAPALAAGCTLVLKTSEKTPLSGLMLAKVIQESEIPKGVVNIISGAGSVGAYLAKHNDVRKISFTGSTAVGHKIMQMSAESNLKRVSLELGGKSPLIVMEDADIDKAVEIANIGLFLNHGQCCAAGSRLFVHEKVYDEFVKKAGEKARQIKVNDGFHPEADQGPQVDKLQFDRVMGYIQKGKEEGAKLVVGGERHGKKGYYIQPTVFADVTDDMTIAKEEIFGPVQSILKYKTYEEVVERANNTIYGLASGIVGKDISQVMTIAKGLEAGTVWINTYNSFDTAAPFGGYKQSGHGRDKGHAALENFLETKTIMLPLLN